MGLRRSRREDGGEGGGGEMEMGGWRVVVMVGLELYIVGLDWNGEVWVGDWLWRGGFGSVRLVWRMRLLS